MALTEYCREEFEKFTTFLTSKKVPKLASFRVKFVNFLSEKGRFSFLLRSLHCGSNRLRAIVQVQFIRDNQFILDVIFWNFLVVKCSLSLPLLVPIRGGDRGAATAPGVSLARPILRQFWDECRMT